MLIYKFILKFIFPPFQFLCCIQKSYMHNTLFFHLNFSSLMWGILAQKIYNVHAIFRQFSDIKYGGWCQKPSILCQLVTSESQCTGISSPTESQSYLLMNKFI